MATMREQVGALIRHHRDRAGLTQTDLAEKIGIAPETVSRLERGTFAPSFDTLVDLATALGVSVRDFFEIGDRPIRDDREDPLADLMVKLAFFDPLDLQWADQLLTLALSRKSNR